MFATNVGLHRVSAQGGEPELLAAPDPQQGELFYAWPELLPGDRVVLFTIVPQGSQGADADSQAQVAAFDLETGEQTIVLRGGSRARYVSTGHLVYSAGSRLHAVSFDRQTLEVHGAGVALSPAGLAVTRQAGADFDVSQTGTLVYVPAGFSSRLRTLVWIDRDGREEPLSTPPANYIYPRVSPDGTRVASDISAENGRDIHIWDEERKSLTRLTDHPTEELLPAWSRDGQRVFFSSDRNGVFNIYSRAADGSGQAELHVESDRVHMLRGLTPDGERLLVGQVGQGGLFDMVSLTAGQPVQVETLRATDYTDGSMAVSPDGHWLAYQSDDSGQHEVYVAPIADVERQRWQISIDGGAHPVWSPAGDELYYRAATGDMMAAATELTPSFAVGEVTQVFQTVDGRGAGTAGARGFDVSPVDGRFLMTKPVNEVQQNGINVVLNWHQELLERVPVP